MVLELSIAACGRVIRANKLNGLADDRVGDKGHTMNDHIAASGKPISLEAVLLKLAKYGQAWVKHVSTGWASGCEGDNDFYSDRNHFTPLSAATQCLERAKAAVKGAK